MDIVTTNLVRLMNISHVAMIVGLSRAEKGVVVVGISWVEAGWKLGLPSSVQVVGNMDEGQYTRWTGLSPCHTSPLAQQDMTLRSTSKHLIHPSETVLGEKCGKVARDSSANTRDAQTPTRVVRCNRSTILQHHHLNITLHPRRPPHTSTHTMSTRSVVIVAASRTPIGSMGGTLASVSATQLGITAVKHAISKAGIASKEVEEVYMGHVVQAGTGQSPARQVALGAG
jgi:hypothetical protein